MKKSYLVFGSSAAETYEKFPALLCPQSKSDISKGPCLSPILIMVSIATVAAKIYLNNLDFIAQAPKRAVPIWRSLPEKCAGSKHIQYHLAQMNHSRLTQLFVYHLHPIFLSGCYSTGHYKIFNILFD